LLSALLRKTLRRLVARKTGPLAFSSILIASCVEGVDYRCCCNGLVVVLTCGRRQVGWVGRAPLLDLSARLSTAPTLLWFYCATKRYALYSARDLIKEVVLFEKSQHHDLFASRNP
jgi:hypothetical protein